LACVCLSLAPVRSNLMPSDSSISLKLSHFAVVDGRTDAHLPPEIRCGAARFGIIDPKGSRTTTTPVTACCRLVGARNSQMSLRIRHCVECPKCHTCYLIAFTPYRNGSYLVRAGAGTREEYILYCFCDGGHMPNRGRWRDVKPCAVSKAAHERGYGTLDEVWICNSSPIG
jgi:hypothetical protein